MVVWVTEALVVSVAFLFVEVKVIVARVVPGSGSGWRWWLVHIFLVVVAIIHINLCFTILCSHFIILIGIIIVSGMVFSIAMFTIIVRVA